MDATFEAQLDLPFFKASHREYAERLDEKAGERLPELRDAHEDERRATRAVVEWLADEGWLVDAVADRGAHLDVRKLCVTRQVLASHWGLADFAFALQGLGSGPITLFGTGDQRTEYLAPVAKGDAIPAFALTEEEAGSDVSAIETRAERDGDDDHYVLEGRKHWISNAGLADFYVVFAKTDEDELSAFVVDADQDGLECIEEVETLSPHPLGTIELEECRVPAEAMLGDPGDGMKIALATLDIFRPTVGAAACGFARAALDLALDHVDEREVFGQRLADFQMTRDDVAEMLTDLEAAEMLVYRAAWKKDDGADRITRQAAMAKARATETAQEVVDRALQLFGARGLVDGSRIEELYRDVRPLRIYEGATEIQKLIVARDLLGE